MSKYGGDAIKTNTIHSWPCDFLFILSENSWLNVLENPRNIIKRILVVLSWFIMDLNLGKNDGGIMLAIIHRYIVAIRKFCYFAFITNDSQN